MVVISIPVGLFGERGVCWYPFVARATERVMVLNATVNTISVISRQSDLLVEETGVPGEFHRPTGNQ